MPKVFPKVRHFAKSGHSARGAIARILGIRLLPNSVTHHRTFLIQHFFAEIFQPFSTFSNNNNIVVIVINNIFN